FRSGELGAPIGVKKKQAFLADFEGMLLRASTQNGISSSRSPPPRLAPAIAGLRSREPPLGPDEPKSSPPPPNSEEPPAPPPRPSSIVSCELKPCSTTSVE